jgi:hypothetical protein
VSDEGPEQTNLTARERDVLRKIAERDGVTEDEAATRLVKTALARRVKKRTGKNPAKVYSIRRK